VAPNTPSPHLYSGTSVNVARLLDALVADVAAGLGWQVIS